LKVQFFARAKIKLMQQIFDKHYLGEITEAIKIFEIGLQRKMKEAFWETEYLLLVYDVSAGGEGV
jgi:hypothetical protein